MKRRSFRAITQLILYVCILCNLTNAFTLEGSPTSYVRYPKWYHQFENVLSFEFKTAKANGLLLYTDDGGNSNFYEISLHDGKLRLQFKIGRRNNARLMRPHIIELGASNEPKSLGDGDWHKVELFQFWERVKLTLDGKSEFLTLEQQDFVFGNYETNSDVFVGGIPESVPSEQLSFKGAKGAERFAGSIRNLVYRTLPHGVTAPHILDSDGLRESDDNHCLQHICANNGICYSTDDGAKCECASDFEGQKCELERGTHEATFLGSEFLSYDFTSNRNGFLSREEQLSIYFKTRRPSGMLFYSGDNQDFLHLAIKDGAVVATSNLGGGSKEVKVVPVTNSFGLSTARFNDNQWHHVVLHRRLTTHTKGLNYLHLSVNVDGVYSDVKQTIGQYEMLSSTVAYVGGKPKNKFIAQVLEDSNFVGCITKIRFRADNRRFDFLDMAKRNDNFIRVYGNLTFMCREPMAPEPITFKRSESYIVLPSWQGAKSGSLSFKFKTNEADGLILYNNGMGKNETDFVAIELINGQLYLILNLGTGTLRMQASTIPLKDKQWHSVTLVRDGRNGRITVDDLTTDFSTPGFAAQLDLGGIMYLGGSGQKINVTPTIWSQSLNKGFIGCLRDFSLNGIVLNLVDYLQESSHGQIELGCAEMLPQCYTAPCYNGGVCIEGWNRHWCDCSATRFIGPLCNTDPFVLTFMEGQYVNVRVGRQLTEVEDIELKFRTRKPSAMLIATSSMNVPDRVELLLTNGQLEYQINFGNGLHTFFWGTSLSDDNWHMLKVRRRGLKLELYVDNEPAVIKEIPPSQHIILEHDAIWAGGSGESNSYKGNSIYASYATGFQGQMAGFLFNGIDIFAKAFDDRTGDSILSNGVNNTKSSNDKNMAKDNVVTFVSRRAYVLLQQKLLSASIFHIVFQFRTLEPNGLIIYGMGRSKDFLSIELQNGKLRYTFNAGDGPEFLTSNVNIAMNDFNWHLVFVHKVNAFEHLLTVDGHTVRLRSAGTSKELNLEGPLYIGGVEKANYSSLPHSVASKHGFRGCLASVAINGVAQDLLSEAQMKEDVKGGCEGPSSKCQADSCAHGGICLQQWQSFNCDCTMTTYGGPKCADHSISYQFGPSPGIISYNFEQDENPSVTDDLLALAVITNQTKSTVFRVESITSTDFLAIQLEDGYPQARYDVGSGVSELSDLVHRVNDGKYHILRFIRSGKNATFQVDDNEIIMKAHSKKNELEVFNNQYMIQLGGRMIPAYLNRKRRSLKNRVSDPFNGILSGVYYNGIRVLDKLAEKDSHVKAEGDVSYFHLSKDEPVPSTRPWSITNDFLPLDGVGISSLEPSENEDDIIYSGGDQDSESSGCMPDSNDEEECIIEEASTTDIITPVLERHTTTTRSTTVPTTTSTTTLAPTLALTTTTMVTTATIDKNVLPTSPDISTTTVDCSRSEDCANDEFEIAPAEQVTAYVKTDHPIAVPSDSDGTPPPLPRPTANVNGGVDGVSGGPKVLTTPHASSDGKPFPRTSVIAGVAVALIVVLIIVVFIVFKCRNKNNDSYSVDETKNYTTLYTNSGEVASTKQPLVNRKTTTQSNGVSRTGKLKKDVKEWYV